MNMLKNILLISFCLVTYACFSQPIINDTVRVNHAKVIAKQDSAVLRVVHIGDSHIQADWFSGEMRRLLQNRLGNAGMGLIFPYRCIKTNGSPSYKITSPFTFPAQKIVKCKTSCNVGVSAYQFEMKSNQWFEVKPKFDSTPQQLTLLYSPLVPKARPVINNIDDVSNYHDTIVGDFVLTKTLFTTTNSFKLSASNDFTLFGIVAENQQPGIIYYTIGANGATFANYNQSELFFNQLAILKPDLIIVSLGTNESVSKITNDSFLFQLQTFQNKLNQIHSASVLYTTPPDNAKRHVIIQRRKSKGKWKKVKKVYYHTNEKVGELRNIMIQFCDEKNLMYWDLYHAMGGAGSMKNWVEAGYAAKDHIHFSKKGYEYQASLFYSALLNCLIK